MTVAEDNGTAPSTSVAVAEPVQTDSRPLLEVRHLAKTFRAASVDAIADLTFDVKPGEFVSIVGPSGCGKTTLLRCLSGLMAPTSGSTHLHGTLVTAPPKDLALVFQDYSRSLFPWLTNYGNVSQPLRNKDMTKQERAEASERALAAVGLEDFGQHYPWQISGGMQQRVAIARAIAYQPTLLLMDEPFASVDALTRAELEDLLLQVHASLNITIVLVTHDIDEAIYLADRVIVLSPRPTRVRDAIDVNLPRPRDQVETKELREFTQLRARIFREILGSHAVGGDGSPSV